VFTSAHSRRHTSSDVLHILKFLKVNFGYSRQRRVAVIKPAVNNSLYIKEWRASLVKELLTDFS